MDKISIGKILNFHGIKGEAKIGYTNKAVIASLKQVIVDDKELNVSSVRFHKNFAIVKFNEINSINELIEFKGKNIFIPKAEFEKKLDKNEYLIDDLIGLKVFDDKEDYIGEVTEIAKTAANDIICIKSPDKTKEKIMVPFVEELVPIVDLKGKKIIIKPIEGLL